MPREKPFCQSGPKWIRDRVLRETGDKYGLAPLTGQDARALQAFFHLIDLYGSSDEDGRRSAVLAMAATVRAMQPSTRHLAKAGIPHVLDWSHEAEIWSKLTLAPRVGDVSPFWLEDAYDQRCRELDAQRELSDAITGTAHQLRDQRDDALRVLRLVASELCRRPDNPCEAWLTDHPSAGRCVPCDARAVIASLAEAVLAR